MTRCQFKDKRGSKTNTSYKNISLRHKTSYNIVYILHNKLLHFLKMVLKIYIQLMVEFSKRIINRRNVVNEYALK